MPYATVGATPMNMGTQCENIDIENQDTVGKSGLRKYFGLGIHTSDPLLNVVKWITYLSEIGAILIVAVLLLLYVLLPASAAAPLVFAFFSLSGGAMSWCYLHWMWVKPSRYLLLGIQQLSALNFLPWMLTVFIHSLPPAYFFYCYMTTSIHPSTLPWPLEGTLWTDLTFWHWLIVWSLILTPLFLLLVVLAALLKVHRLKLRRIEIESPSILPEADLPPSYSVVFPLHSVDIPETSPLSEDDLPPSYLTAVLLGAGLM